MRFATLIALIAADGSARFIYGNALPDNGQLRPQARWHPKHLDLHGGISIVRYTRALTDESFVELETRLLSGASIVLLVEEPSSRYDVILHGRPPMVRRPPVRATRADQERLTPVKWAEERHTTLWSSDLRSVLDRIIPDIAPALEGRVDRVHAFVQGIRRLTGLPFPHGQFWRIGTFEIIDMVIAPASGGTPLIQVAMDGTSGLVLRITLREPLASVASDTRIQVLGGSDVDVALPILERLIDYRGDDIEVQLPESGVAFRIDVYGGEDRSVIASAKWTRSQSASMSHRPVRDDEREWLPLLENELRAEVTRAWATESSTTGARIPDPWVTAQGLAVAYERAYFPARAPGFALLEEPASQRAAVRGFIESAGAGRLFIADPYFDVNAARTYFRGRRDLLADVTIITSLRDDTDSSKTTLSECETDDSPSLRELLDFVHEHGNELPRRMRIVNIQSAEAGNGAQFHDRFVQTIRGNGASALWWLGNSLNSISESRRYPLFYARVRGAQRLQYAEYIARLGRGELTARPEARAREHWQNAWAPDLAPTIAPILTEMPVFSGWSELLERLARVAGIQCDLSGPEGIESTVRALVDGHILGAWQHGSTWRLHDEGRAAVATALASEVCATADDALLYVIELIARWSYHGGLHGADVALPHDQVDRVLAVTSIWLQRQIEAEPEDWPAANVRGLENDLDEVVERLENQRYDNRACSPLLVFVRDLALAHAPGPYLDFVVRERCEAVYRSITAWNYPQQTVTDRALTLGDQRLTAEIIGALIAGGGDSGAPDAALSRAELVDHERAYGLTYVLLTKRVEEDETVAALDRIWAGKAMVDGDAERVGAAFDRGRAGFTIAALKRLAATHPESGSFGREIVRRWTRYLLPRETVKLGEAMTLDGYSRSVASGTPLAIAVVEQFATLPDGAQQFVDQVLSPLDLSDLRAPFIEQIDGDAWEDAAHRACRVLFAGCLLLGSFPKSQPLARGLEKLSRTLNAGAWDRVGYDYQLIGVNAVRALALAAHLNGALDAQLAAIVSNNNVTPVLRLTAIVEADNGLRRFADSAASLAIRDDLFAGLGDGPRQGVIDGLLRRLSAEPDGAELEAKLRASR